MEIFGETIDRELVDLARRACARASSDAATARRSGCRRSSPGSSSDAEKESRLNLWIAFDYGGRAEIVEAARRLAESGAEVDEDAFAQHLYAPEMPDPDLVIRTSGELRVSNFLLWQSAYAEFVFTDTLWPDFGPDELRAAIEDYASRRRRFGGR